MNTSGTGSTSFLNCSCQVYDFFWDANINACRACEDGFFLDKASNVCRPRTACLDGEYIVFAGNTTMDRVCARCTPCAEGQRITNGKCTGSTYGDRGISDCTACTACALGEYINQYSAFNSTHRKVCDGTGTQDRTTCTKCRSCGDLGFITNNSFCSGKVTNNPIYILGY